MVLYCARHAPYNQYYFLSTRPTGERTRIMTVELQVTPAQIQAVADTVQVHKFGGSSLADAYCYRRVARIVTEYARSEEHTSELQSRPHLVCRLLLEKKKKK